MAFYEVKHPLVAHKLGLLRDVNTPSSHFRELCADLGSILFYEASRKLPLRKKTIKTPLEETEVEELAVKNLILAPVLRAGLGMIPHIKSSYPEIKVAHIGIFRNEDTLKPELYYLKLPREIEDSVFYILDPMLATGGSLAYAVEKLKEHGAKKIVCLCIIAAPEGVAYLEKSHPEIVIFAAALDRELNKHGFILPGLGDAGDRLFGT
ncbi:MAG: uracil phosphoribosyltransferase [Leptospiraceae bacterium]|nr:uracil phosphoribosyltransferase [Leptospiraceae bacterium]MDW8307670.1 uracil phosphoribosyltransferase [Leptospiraceae bacterium]